MEISTVSPELNESVLIHDSSMQFNCIRVGIGTYNYTSFIKTGITENEMILPATGLDGSTVLLTISHKEIRKLVISGVFLQAIALFVSDATSRRIRQELGMPDKFSNYFYFNGSPNQALVVRRIVLVSNPFSVAEFAKLKQLYKGLIIKVNEQAMLAVMPRDPFINWPLVVEIRRQICLDVLKTHQQKINGVK